VDAIFDEFAQAGRRSGHKGSGLGLAICRRIVEAHGGSIWATSKLQAGSTFTFSLPQPPSQDAART
jgi:signal transduction histidine kinase